MPDSRDGERDQRRLHAWPEWDASIDRARKRLAFDAAWTPPPGDVQSPDYVRWRKATHPRRLEAEARRAVTDLRLPERFMTYWLACFFAPYGRDGLAAIRAPSANGGIRDNRVFPPPAELWFEAGVDISTAPPTLVIEGPAALASSAVLRLAERRALEAKRQLGLTRQHPSPDHDRSARSSRIARGRDRCRTRRETGLSGVRGHGTGAERNRTSSHAGSGSAAIPSRSGPSGDGSRPPRERRNLTLRPDRTRRHPSSAGPPNRPPDKVVAAA